MVLKVEYASQCREMEALAVHSKQQLPVTGERQRMGFEYKCEICAGVQRPAENWGQSGRLLLCISFSVTDEQFSWPLFFLSANVFGLNIYECISTHIYMCVCMMEDNYFSALRCSKQANAYRRLRVKLSQTLREKLSCSCSCCVPCCSPWARAFPSLGGGGVTAESQQGQKAASPGGESCP